MDGVNNGNNVNFVLDKLDSIKNALDSNFLERKEVIDMIILAVISKKHSILIGEPGLAKTAVLKALAMHIKGLKLFDFQMTPATGIGELMSINNQNKTGIDNCDIALIDEFFKGPHATLNSLLAVMNERIVYAPEPRKIPLISLFATSNEKPDKSSDANLLPLYDRFLFRKEITPIKNGENFKRLLELKDEYDFNNTLSEKMLERKDFDMLASAVDTVCINGDIYNYLYVIREELRNKQVIVSDRRWRETVKILKANALLNKRDAVVKGDIGVLEPSLWTYYSDIRAVKNILRKELQ
ncbi:MAG: AAA family ATPase [bacterium]|jgi:MoxR-like ATPase